MILLVGFPDFSDRNVIFYRMHFTFIMKQEIGNILLTILRRGTSSHFPALQVIGSERNDIQGVD